MLFVVIVVKSNQLYSPVCIAHQRMISAGEMGLYVPCVHVATMYPFMCDEGITPRLLVVFLRNQATVVVTDNN